MWFKAISDPNVEYSMGGDGGRMWVRPVCGGAAWGKRIVSIAPRLSPSESANFNETDAK